MKIKVYSSTPPFDLILGPEDNPNIAFGYSNVQVNDETGVVTFDAEMLTKGAPVEDFEEYSDENIKMMDVVILEFISQGMGETGE